MGSLFLIYFRIFKQKLQILQQIIVKNVHPLYCLLGFKPTTSEHERPLKTNGPGLKSN